MKKLFASILCFAMICGITGCSSSSDEYEIAMITDSGSVTDKSFNQSAYEGVKEFGEKNDMTYKYYAPKDTDTAGLLSTVDDAVDNGAKVIVTPGFNFNDAIVKAQEKYPDVKFITIDFEPSTDKGVVTGDNTTCYLFCEEESGYVAGYAAVKEGYTKLGFAGGMSLPAVQNYGIGYVQGASDAAKELGVNVEINYTYTGTFNESPEIKTLATAWYNSGTEVIFSCGGQICNSIFAAAQEGNKATIGVDTDQNDDSDTVITSALKDVKGATMKGLQAYKDDKFKGGETVTFKNAGGIAYPGRLKNFKKDDYNTVDKKIKDGSIELKSSKDLTEADKGNPAKLNFPNVTVNFQ